MKIGNSYTLKWCASMILCLLLFYPIALVECSSKLTLKPGQRLDTVLKFYESIYLNPIDESLLDYPAPRDELASKEGELPIHLKISALNQTFALHLHMGESIFTADAKIVIHGKNPEVMDARDFRTNYVEGYLLGEPRSTVRGHVHDGAFFGSISLGNARYYVEPAATYFQNVSRFDAIIYEESDVEIYPKGNFSFTNSFCRNDKKSRPREENPSTETDASSYSRDWDSSNEFSVKHRFGARPAKVGKACKIKVVADHFFSRTYGGPNIRKTIAEMEFHVKAADDIFASTDINGDGRADEIHIRLARAEVFQSPTSPSYLLGDSKLNASQYLELFSLYNHDGFCGAMAFSQRPFAEDVLGFAYRGGPDRMGGICERRQVVEGQMRNLNVGMTSPNIKGTIIPRARSTIVFTHELGHMFGSQHDEDAEGGRCFIQNEKKHYVMSSIANLGITGYNRRFSTCSAKQMYENVKAHGRCLPCRGRDCGVGHRVTANLLLVLLAISLGSLSIFVVR